MYSTAHVGGENTLGSFVSKYGFVDLYSIFLTNTALSETKGDGTFSKGANIYHLEVQGYSDVHISFCTLGYCPSYSFVPFLSESDGLCF